MARHVRAAELESIPRPVIAVGNDYPDGHLHPAHRHRRSQLLFAERGTMVVETAQGTWMVPPSQAVWIPAGVSHGITMLGHVSTRSIYLDPTAAAGMPEQCQVVGVSPLLRELLIAAVDLPAEYEPDSRAGRIMGLLLDEVRVTEVLPLSLPMPAHASLATRCRRFIARPAARETIDLWCRDLAMSRRTFTRLFRAETGLAFTAWQRRACLLWALPRLLRGERVTTIAFDLGYSSPAAFATMFKQLVGSTPDIYRRHAARQGMPGMPP
jgi:AraC-like DNA-binding protein